MSNSSRLAQTTLIDEFKSNRRLQIGLALIALVIVVEGGLRWSDHLSSQAQLLGELQMRRVALQSRSRDAGALEERLERLRNAETAAQARLWQVPSEAVGQAKQKDWLLETFKTLGVTPQSIVLATPKAGPAERDSAPRNEVDSVAGVRRFRATLMFQFSPAALESVLVALESGEPFVDIESLVVNRRQRRVELTIATLMDVVPLGPGMAAPVADAVR